MSGEAREDFNTGLVSVQSLSWNDLHVIFTPLVPACFILPMSLPSGCAEVFMDKWLSGFSVSGSPPLNDKTIQKTFQDW